MSLRDLPPEQLYGMLAGEKTALRIIRKAEKFPDRQAFAHHCVVDTEEGETLASVQQQRRELARALFDIIGIAAVEGVHYSIDTWQTEVNAPFGGTQNVDIVGLLIPTDFFMLPEACEAMAQQLETHWLLHHLWDAFANQPERIQAAVERGLARENDPLRLLTQEEIAGLQEQGLDPTVLRIGSFASTESAPYSHFEVKEKGDKFIHEQMIPDIEGVVPGIPGIPPIPFIIFSPPSQMTSRSVGALLASELGLPAGVLGVHEDVVYIANTPEVRQAAAAYIAATPELAAYFAAIGKGAENVKGA